LGKVSDYGRGGKKAGRVGVGMKEGNKGKHTPWRGPGSARKRAPLEEGKKAAPFFIDKDNRN